MGRVAAVVLAAGAGTRFAGGTHKLLASLRGRPLAAWALEHARDAGLDATVVITGAVDLGAAVPDGVEVVHNERWAEGQATSLRVAIDWADARGFDAIVVGLADQPFVEPASWRAVAAADAPIAVATYDGARRNPVRLAREVWPLLPDEGDEGARAVFGQYPDLVAEVACRGEPGDVDSLEDLEAWS